jgi:hypothetical protein
MWDDASCVCDDNELAHWSCWWTSYPQWNWSPSQVWMTIRFSTSCFFEKIIHRRNSILGFLTLISWSVYIVPIDQSSFFLFLLQRKILFLLFCAVPIGGCCSKHFCLLPLQLIFFAIFLKQEESCKDQLTIDNYNSKHKKKLSSMNLKMFSWFIFTLPHVVAVLVENRVNCSVDKFQ